MQVTNTSTIGKYLMGGWRDSTNWTTFLWEVLPHIRGRARPSGRVADKGSVVAAVVGLGVLLSTH